MVNDGGFPSMKATKLRQILKKRLGYRIRPGAGKGSHSFLDAEGRPSILWAFHNGDTIAPGLVRQILVKQAGLTIKEAKEVLGNG